jgi:UDP-N-acetyl-D-galactosamine dehydrogenase
MNRPPVGPDTIIAVIGLGYVGLPLAVEFGRKYRTIGFDLNQKKIDAYRNYLDPTGEVSANDLHAVISNAPNRVIASEVNQSSPITIFPRHSERDEAIRTRLSGLELTTDPCRLAEADFLIIAVPTPIDEAHIPDFKPLIGASTSVGRHMKPGATVIYESTVYPGATEEVCIPVLEKQSNMQWACRFPPPSGGGEGAKKFYVGYSPERINPGDREHTLTRIVKVVSGDSYETLERVAALYCSIIESGVHRAASIKVAEAAKVIENTQRDLNIALMNELAIIFDKIGIDTTEVLEAAGTKWNFLNFKPGLVGGHCIGVDPYYLTHKAEMLGYHPQVILAGRRINDGMAAYIAQRTVKELIRAGVPIHGSKVTILGVTFKENCPDLRNSKVVDLVRELKEFGCEVVVHDPIAHDEDVKSEYGFAMHSWDELDSADALIVAVPHAYYLQLSYTELLSKIRPVGVILDVKSSFKRNNLLKDGVRVWRL